MKDVQKNLVNPPENPGFRFYLGLALFVTSFFMLPTGLVLKGLVESHFWKGFILAIFWLSAPLMKLSAIAILGKSSYNWIRYKLHFYRKVAIPDHVSPTRYTIGLFLFVFPFIPNYILSYAPKLFPDAYLIRTAVHFFFDMVFISSLFVLGGNFWDKLRALFVYSAKAKFENESEIV
ncbi:MAG: hypothetical protein PHF97_03675 [Bacteroidales bacterium]|nr:hypothetical protein [Bacteroidales bacterium]MDD4602888.1 hypothetical protein [Bacteroidales bacterium]